MNADAMLRTGAIGSIVSALCCFTNLPHELLAFLGLPSLLAYSDNISVLALALFLLLLMYGGLKKLERGNMRSD